MNSPTSPELDDGPRQGTLEKVWALLNRDVRTLKWRRQNKLGPETDDALQLKFKSLTEPLKESAPEVVSEVDPRKVDDLRLRREVLDWRDEFQLSGGQIAHPAFAGRAEAAIPSQFQLNFIKSNITGIQLNASLLNHKKHDLSEGYIGT